LSKKESCQALVDHICNHSQSGDSQFEASLRQILHKTYLTKPSIKEGGAGGVAQVVECVPRMPEALTSNVSATQKMNK
jgi:hypothetical protein